MTAASGSNDLGPLPFWAGPPNFHVGLKPIDPALWLFPDDQTAWLPEKNHLLNTRRAEVLAQDAQSIGAQSELLAAIHAASPLPPIVAAQVDEPPLVTAARHVSDDLVILQCSVNAWQVVACCLCNPTFFSAPFALGKSLAELHAPVPDQGFGLASRIDRVFTHVQTGQVLERHNWTVQWSNARFTPDGAPLRHMAQSAKVTGGGEHLFVRVERQTITRLPLCGAIVFTIRVSLTSLSDIVADDGARAAFTFAWKDAPEHVRRYKRWAVLEPHVAALLANCNERRT